MSHPVGQREIQTQKRVLAFFQDAIGYAYLGHKLVHLYKRHHNDRFLGMMDRWMPGFDRRAV